MPDDTPLWTPSEERIGGSHLRAFAGQLRDAGEIDALRDDGTVDFDLLWRWSVAHPERFWPAMWRHGGIVAEERPGGDPWERVVMGLERMAPPDPELGPRWFLGARLNFAVNLLRHRGDREAVVSWDESGRRSALTFDELRHAVAAARAAPLEGSR